MSTTDTTSPRPTLTTESGAPVVDNQRSQTAGADGPVLLQDVHLVEKLARFNRERVPERVVHAVGSAAYGKLVTTHDMSPYTTAKLFNGVGTETEVFARFSTVAGSRGAPDTARDPRGFALKFYTEDGNYDLVGNNTPIFFLRDPLKFPDFIHSQKQDPFTNEQEPNNVWDFFALSPEATHQFVWLFGDRGRPDGYRHMDGFGSHTYRWTNAAGESFWVKYHFKTNQGIRTLTDAEAERLGGENPQYAQHDLHTAIERGDHPSWTLKVQIMPEAEAASYKVNPFDLTKVWNHVDYPLVEVGTMTLDRNPDNYFGEVEQAAFNPGNFVPGIGPSPDKMLQGRLFGYGDAHRYRLSTNFEQLPVNRPHATTAQNYGQDGTMAAHSRDGRQPNYEPNSRGGPVETGAPYTSSTTVSGEARPHSWDDHAAGDDYAQAGDLYRLMDEAAQGRLVATIVGSLGQVTLPGVKEAAVEHFRRADAELGARLDKELGLA